MSLLLERRPTFRDNAREPGERDGTHIGLDAAKRTMKVTTQLGVRSLVHPAQRRFRTAMPHLRYPRLHGTFYGEIMKSEVKSLRTFTYAHLIGNGKGFSKFFLMTVKNETVQLLDDFVQTHVIMDRLLTDGDPTMEATKARKKAVFGYKIHQKWTEPHSPMAESSGTRCT
jgi:hypothetical protein